MIAYVSLVIACVSLPTSFFVVLLGKRFLWLNPSVRKLDKEEGLITGILLSREAISDKGESIYAFTTKIFKRELLQQPEDEPNAKQFLDRYKVGHVLFIAYYYYDKKIDKEFKIFKYLCNLISVFACVSILNALHSVSAPSTISSIILSFDTQFFAFFSLAQMITFLFVVFNVYREISKINNMFNPRATV